MTTQILASQTPGTAAPVNGPFDTWEISAAGAALRNDVVVTGATSGVLVLYYHNHYIYQYANTTVSGVGTYATPGSGSISFGGNTYTIDSSDNMDENGSPISGGSGTGALDLYNNTLYAQDLGSGTWYTWSGTAFAGPVAAPPNLPGTGSGPAWSYWNGTTWISTSPPTNESIDGTLGVYSLGGGIPQPPPTQVALNSISLSGTTFTANTSGAAVGTITVNTTPSSSFSGTLSHSNTTQFSLSANSLSTAAALATTGNPYSDTITATQSGATNSPLQATFNTLTATASSGVGPGVSGSWVNIDFTNTTSPNGIANAVVHPQLFGVATSGIFGQDFASNTTFQSLVKSLAPPLFRLNSDTVGGNPTVMASLASHATSIFPSTCTIIIGADSSYQTVSTWCQQNWPIAVTHFEVNNEIGGQPDTISNYQSNYYVPGAAGFHSTSAAYNVGGPIWAGFDGSALNTGPSLGAFASFIADNTATTLQFLDWHQYLYCNGSPWITPTNSQVCQAYSPNVLGGATLNSPSPALATVVPVGYCFETMITQWQALTAGTYTSQYPLFLGEWNIECSASFNDLRAGTSAGAAFMCSVLMGAASASTQPVWAAVWDLIDDAGAAYNLIDSSLNVYPQYYCLQQLIAHAPGTMVNSVGVASGLRAWATVNAGNICVVIINSNGSVSTGSLALSHWPLNTSGTATIHVWTYPTSGNIGPPGATVANTPGTTSTLSVVGGLATVSVPAYSAAIVYSQAGDGGTAVTLNSIALSSNTFTANTANAAVGTLSVNTTPGSAFTGTLTHSNTTQFTLSGTTLTANSLAPGTYSDTFTATQTGATNSPLQITISNLTANPITGNESPSGTLIPPATSITDANAGVWTLSGGVAYLNGSMAATNSSVIEVAYYNHIVYQEASNANNLGLNPGWWQWTGSTWSDCANPTPTGPGISIATISPQSTNTAFTVAGAMVGYASAPTLQYLDTNP